jgi:mono/diheme cytochrome c family protein
MKKIHPVFIFTAPVMVLVSYAQYDSSASPTNQPAPSPPAILSSPVSVTAGRALFLRNCAHCHGADAHGDDGPDLHGIGWTNPQITSRILHGKAGQMTAFAGKLPLAQIDSLVAYVQTLK